MFHLGWCWLITTFPSSRFLGDCCVCVVVAIKLGPPQQGPGPFVHDSRCGKICLYEEQAMGALSGRECIGFYSSPLNTRRRMLLLLPSIYFPVHPNYSFVKSRKKLVFLPYFGRISSFYSKLCPSHFLSTFLPVRISVRLFLSLLFSRPLLGTGGDCGRSCCWSGVVVVGWSGHC